MPKIAPPPPKPQATISGKRALHLFHVRRFNWTQIGRILGCSSSGASIAAEREAKRRGIRLRRRQRVWIDAGRVLALRRKGMSWDAIAIKLRCSPSGARVAAYRNGYREEE
jgi:hypothetical protein